MAIASEKDALKASFPELVEKLQADDIVDRLYQSSLLTQAEYEGIVKDIPQKDVRGVNRRILLAVSKGPKGSVAKFAEILRKSQQELATELLRSLYQAHRSVSEPKLTMTEGIPLQRPDTPQPLTSSSMPSQTDQSLLGAAALAMSQSTPMASPMEERVTDLERQLQVTNSRLEKLSSSMEVELPAHEDRIGELDQQLKKATSTMQAELSSHKETIAELEQQLKKATSSLEKLSAHVQVFQTTSLLQEELTLHSEKLPDLPLNMACVTAVIIDGKVYVCGGRCGDSVPGCLVHVYTFGDKKWVTLSVSAPQYRCEPIVINNQLVFIGGREASSRKITNIVSTWTGQCWKQELPAMPTKRCRPGVIVYDKYVVVAGGMSDHNKALLSSIDILDTMARQWWTPANFQLPKPMYALSVTTSSSYVYVATAIIDYDITNNTKIPSNEAWQLPIDVLEEVLTMKSNSSWHRWTDIAPTPHCHSTLLKGNAQPMVIGGSKVGDRSGSNSVSEMFVYDCVRNKWSLVGQLRVPRARCAAVCVSGSSFLVCGGYSDTAQEPQPRMNSVELLTVQR